MPSEIIQVAAEPARSTPKRGAEERRGLHAWLPYYAGYSEAFVAEMLSLLGVKKNALVLDPMNGSGTTTVAAQKHGLLSIGIELNPAAAVISRAKDAALVGCCDWDTVLESVAYSPLNSERMDPEEEVDWIPRSILSQLRRLAATIGGRGLEGYTPLYPKIREAVRHTSKFAAGPADLLLAALLRVVRRYSRLAASKNPTWFKLAEGSDDVDANVIPEFLATARAMIRDLQDELPGSTAPGRVLVLEGDARAMDLHSDVADAIITSPPYLTRIDYAVGTAPELAFLGYATPSRFHDLRASIMGSTCVTGGDYGVRGEWGRICLSILDAIRAHTSKASSGYYYKTHVQYFRDAEAFLSDSIRALKPGASAVLVIQDSWYKDIHVPLAKIYAEMAVNLGAVDARVLYSVPVRSHIGQVNTKARLYKKGDLHEHVVTFTK